MRNTVHNAVAGARGILDRAAQSLDAGNTLTEDEMLQRYELQHRGNPLGMAQFVAQHSQGNPLAEWRKYETAMEQLRKRRGF